MKISKVSICYKTEFDTLSFLVKKSLSQQLKQEKRDEYKQFSLLFINYIKGLEERNVSKVSANLTEMIKSPIYAEISCLSNKNKKV